MRPPNKGHLLAPHTTELKRCFEPGTAPASVIVAGEQGYEVSINVHGTFVRSYCIIACFALQIDLNRSHARAHGILRLNTRS